MGDIIRNGGYKRIGDIKKWGLRVYKKKWEDNIIRIGGLWLNCKSAISTVDNLI